MVYLRATQRALRFLGPASPANKPSDTALGDWFVNRFVIDRRPFLILVSSASLLTILEPARRVRSLPERLSDLVSRRLHRLGVADALIQGEINAMDEVRIAPTNDRSVVGTMVDFVHSLRYYATYVTDWDESALASLEQRLARTPCRSSRAMSEVIWPDRRAKELLRADGITPASERG